jgi:ceramide glucosyltransferase
VYFCISSTEDPAYPILKQLLADFPDADAKIFTEPPYADHELGPNPKIRNMSRAYREAKGDIIWIVDCNVWLGKGVCGRMVDRLCGFDPKYNGGRKYKFVHHLPIVVDVNGDTIEDGEPSIPGNDVENLRLRRAPKGIRNSIISRGGGRLEELFLASSHAKMYSAINTVLIAPCIVGKSSMFRRSHLDYLTSPAAGAKPYRLPRPPGIDYFSDNICEDHLIGDRLWYGKLPEEVERVETWGKHSLVFGDIAVQPMSGMSLSAYIDRRIRWLRVRKFTVLLATLVEPGTESFLCSLYLAFGAITVLPRYFPAYAGYLETWGAFFTAWVLSILLWMAIDWTVYLRLHSASAIEVDEHTPPFALPHRGGKFARRPFQQWLLAWLGREALALPIWTWAFYCGSTVVWRDRVFRVGMDMVAHEIRPSGGNSLPGPRSPASANNGATVGISRTLRRRTPNGSLTKAGGLQANGAAVSATTAGHT